MPLIYITGCAGSGKTTIKRKLIQLGYEAHDEDDPDIGSAHNKSTNIAVKVPPVNQRTPLWFSEHEYRIFPEALAALKKHSAKKLIFLCGNVATEIQLREFFDKVIFLDIDEQTLRNRLASRKDNDFGHAEYEIQMILMRNRAAKILYKKIKSEFVDASKPIEAVCSEIIALAK